jgi:predicted DsbA family dithiol-disulfide isomerase
MRIDIFSDTVCPWCYLGKRRLELAVAARPQYDARLTWRPFELNPELPVNGIERSAYLAARSAELKSLQESEVELVRIGAACGIQFRFDLIQRVPNTRMSHLMIAYAARFGRQGEVKERVMRGYFEEGRDIGDVEELVSLGAETGLPVAQTRRSLITRSGQDGVVAAERHAHVLGISGVPTFIFNGQYTLSGAQEVGTFAQVLDQVVDLAATKESTA